MTNSPTISEMNEVIARFMGATLFEYVDGYAVLDLTRDGINNKIYVYSLKYHSSYDWLMPVWNKFIDLTFDDEGAESKHAELKTKIGHAILYARISIAHGDLYQGIQWFNKQKNDGE